MNASDAGFLTHLEALRQVLWRSVAAVGVLLVPGFFAAPEVLGFLVRFTCPPDFKLNYFTPMEPLIVQLKLGLFLAVVAAMPVILRQAARFVAPALYEHERRAAGRAVAAATLLFLAGAAVGLFLVVPLMMKFSAAYASESLAPVIGIGSFVNLVGLLALSFGVMFQLPVVMVLLVRCGVVEVGTLKRSRPLAVTVIFILAALLTPPDVVSQLLLGVPTWLLFEAALLVAARCSPRNPPPEEPPPARSAVPERTAAAVAEESPENDAETALDAVYRESYRKKRRKNRRFGMINGHYRTKRGGKK
ncbi:twin-arginine translocase subunit TatC [Victivallaceae bacterium BBE-744-WT-12]|uniref:Sec-independent protein translocase protein TatC n=1 Tax=Victivallis lenta TaxID=2606640 RepID=A0A844G6I0_9BACT|nr:twin-arginine translocase subunit TatC [Victivallis lenta]MST98181.1 twin-arginine translocase subunit TatC [Victivallis lenta]HBP06314.1 twin-arginine translocase subunit TatC [Lentisphaeria bacterium]HCH84897.1 twin-arginine translocase subunit TatC [Lentisphaeria bacterium]